MDQNTLTKKYRPPANPGDEVVISGISGRFPSSKNVLELKHNLMEKKNLITSNTARWKIDHAEIPTEAGIVHGLEKFDAFFFGIHFKQAHTMDPMCRLLMEHAYEAVMDAGINPKELRGTNTGVIVGSCFSETEKTLFYEKLQANGLGIVGCSKAMLANRVSYALDLRGPSFVVDTACSSSMTAMDQAFRMIQNGLCDKVLVGGSNLCIHPYTSLQFYRLGVLSSDCRCKSFDENANGYVRSDAICMILLQKASGAKRIYSTVCYTKTNCDGYKTEGITYPAFEVQKQLLQNFYKECDVPKTSLNYLEAHATGTTVGDVQELKAITEVLCENRKEPLKIGSVKSNIGHTEPTSGLCSIAKVIIAMETGIIPPNVNFRVPRKDVKELQNGQLQVIVDPTPWDGGYAGINSFGFGGANAHLLVKSNPKAKINNGAPTDSLPRIVVTSGRTEKAVSSLLESVKDNPIDVEHVRLLHDIFDDFIPNHIYRGYTIVGSKTAENPIREIREYHQTKRPIWFVFSGMGSQWAGMGESLMRFPIFAKAIQKCDAVLRPRGIDIVNIITTKDNKIFDNVLNSFVGIAAVQIGLVDLLTALGIVPDNIIGHSVGELGCAYADGCFTAEQMVLSAYSRGLASIETELIDGSMAAIGLGYEDMKDLCPPDIEIACHNGPDSCTISGAAASVKEFVSKLQANNIFAKEVPCSRIAYHSRYIAAAGPKLLAYLKKVIPNPKPRSPKWLSTSVPRKDWSSPVAQLSSAEYHTNNLLNSVLFAETATLIPKDAITIEIAPHGLLQAILKRSLHENVANIPLTQRGNKDSVDFFLQALGKLYNIGLQLHLMNIYPPVQFPVSRGTPMIAPHIKWDHSYDWYVAYFTQRTKLTKGERFIELGLYHDSYEYMVNHVIDGRNLIPATGYLVIVWETMAMMLGKMYDEVSVILENIKFERATTVPKEGFIDLLVTIQKGTGAFEIVENNTAIVKGVIRVLSKPSEAKIPTQFISESNNEEPLTTKDIYKEFKIRGYDYKGSFQGIKRASIGGNKGHIAWTGNWAVFMDLMLQFRLLGHDTRGLFVPTRIRKLVIDTKQHNDMIRNLTGDSKEFPIQVYKDFDVISAGGIEIHGLHSNAISRRKQMTTPVLEEYKFVPNRDKAEVLLTDMVTFSAHMVLENSTIIHPKVIELVTEEDEVTAEHLISLNMMQVFGDLPMTQPTFILATNLDQYKETSLPSNITVMDLKKMPENGSTSIAIGYDIFSKNKRDCVEQLLLAIKDNGFLLTQETIVNNKILSCIESYNFKVVLEKSFNGKTFLLLKRQEKAFYKTEIVYINNYEFSWLEKIQNALKQTANDSTKTGAMRLVLVAENDLENGALGLTKCLRREPNGEIIRTVIIQDENAPKFSLDNPLYAEQLEIDLAINVLRPGNVWGTYRHLPIPPLQLSPVPHAYVSQMVPGDLNSLQWLKGQICPDVKKQDIVYIEYGSLNFRDVMIATGKLAPETIARKREHQDCLIGFEYSGVTASGRRVMGFVPNRGLSNICILEPSTSWDVPDEWSLEDAATVPAAYCTAYLALFFYGKIKKSDKVLIHAGSGALGQAAINYALYEGCEVFTTVGTPEKREFIKKTFPSIDDNHIGNTRDTSFEQLIQTQTKGRGVDIVLNSLAEDKLQASVRCLAKRGRFLEVGKFDLSVNNQLGLEVFLKEISFHAIMLDNAISLDEDYSDIRNMIHTQMISKAVKPIVRTCFPKHKVQAAFKYMAAGKHIGKVVIKMRDDGEPLNRTLLAYPRFYAEPDKSYVIVGGLGGLGLELTDWLVLRGARSIVLISRNGIKNGYQRMRIETWKSYGAKVLILSGVDASKTDDCEFILKTAERQAPVDGIFNLAALLYDNLCINQTVKTFEESLKPKMWITRKLDEVSRKICPKLRHFVVFSSISCGRGNLGQSNYGMGNAVMERICEKRVEDGLPGLAIQWGSVGEVGLAAEMLENNKELTLGGTLPQRISSCLEVLDNFLTLNKPIVASMVVAEKHISSSGASTALEAVMNIMGLKDLKGISPIASLAEVGMDSMLVVEIRQVLERDFEIFLTSQDVRNLTIAKLIQMSENTSNKESKVTSVHKDKANLVNLDMVMRVFSTKANLDICVEYPIKSTENKQEIFFIPGIEGCSAIFSPLTEKLKYRATCLQLDMTLEDQSIDAMVNKMLPHVLERSKNRKDFVIVGYSYGSLLAIQLSRRLEAEGFTGSLILIDGSPDFLIAIKNQNFAGLVDNELETKLLSDILSSIKSPLAPEFIADLKKCTSWDERVQVLISHIPPEILKAYNTYDVKSVCTSIYKRLDGLKSCNFHSLPPIKTPITLLKPTSVSITGLAEDYGLKKLTQGKVEILKFEGNHVTILDNDEVAKVINGDTLGDKESFERSLYSEVTEMNMSNIIKTI